MGYAKECGIPNEVVWNGIKRSYFEGIDLESGEMAEFLSGAVDSDKLKECLDSGKYDSRLGEDSAIASSLGINGTPGFYINSVNFAGAYSYKDMESAVNSAL